MRRKGNIDGLNKVLESVKELTDKKNFVLYQDRKDFVKLLYLLFEAFEYVLLYQGSKKTKGDVLFHRVHKTSRHVNIEFKTDKPSVDRNDIFSQLRKVSKAFKKSGKKSILFDFAHFDQIDYLSVPKTLLQKMDLDSDQFIIAGESSRDFGLRLGEYLKQFKIHCTVRQNLDPTNLYMKRFQVNDGPLALSLLSKFKDLHVSVSLKGLGRMVTVYPIVDSNRGNLISKAVASSEIIEFLSLIGEEKSAIVVEFISLIKFAKKAEEKIRDLEQRLSQSANLRDVYLKLSNADIGLYKSGAVNKIGIEKFLKIIKSI